MKLSLNKTVAAISFVLCISVTSALIWASGHGFEFSDESFYYLGLKYFENAPDLNGTPFHRLLFLLLDWTDPTLHTLRISRLVLFGIAALITFEFLVSSVARNSSTADKVILFSLLLLGLALGYARGPQALSYNSLSSVAMCVIPVFWFRSLLSTSRIMNAFRIAVIGGLAITLVFIKITNLLVFSVLIIGTAFWYKKHPDRVPNLRMILLFSIAFIVGGVAVLWMLTGPERSMINLLNETISSLALKSSNNSGHSIVELQNKYWLDIKQVWARINYAICGLAGLFLLIFALHKTKVKPIYRLGSSLYALLSMMILITMVYLDQHWLGGTSRKYHLIDFYVLIWVVAYLNQFFQETRINQYWILGLLFMPVLGAIGTNNGLSSQFLHYAIFLFIGLWLMVKTTNSPWTKYTLLTLLVLISASQTITGVVADPYRQNDLRQSQFEVSSIPPLNGIQVDIHSSDLSISLKQYHQFTEEYVFSFSHQSGVIILLNKKPFSLQWFNPGNSLVFCDVVSSNKIESNNLFFATPREYPLSQEDIVCLKESGIQFEEYKIIDTIEYFDFVRNKTFHLEIRRHKSHLK